MFPRKIRYFARASACCACLLVASPAFAHPTGSILVVNDSGGDLQVALPEWREGRMVRAGERVILDAPVGQTVVRATYVQFGEKRLLDSETVIVRPARATVVTLAPERTTRLMVSNQTRGEGSLFADGSYLAHLDGGEAELVTVPVGAVHLSLVTDNGRILGQTDLRARPFAEQAWTIEAPRVADLAVMNPLPIAVVVSLDVDGTETRVLGPSARTVFCNVPVGEVTLTARRTTGEKVDRDTILVKPYDDATWRVDAPTTGLLVVDSDVPLPTTIFVDGIRVASLNADVQRTLELDVGWHRIQVVDPRDRRLEDEWIEVKPFGVASMDVDPSATRPPSVASRDDDDQREPCRPQ
jgi:hypothetical protein